MLFSIHESAVNAGERVYNALDNILARAEASVHEIEFRAADLLEDGEWYKSCRTDRRKLLQKIAQSSIYQVRPSEGPHFRQIDISDEMSAERAQAIAYTPLTLLLENSFSDGALVKAAINTFGKPETIELCFGAVSLLDPTALELLSGGGHGELLKLLEQRLGEAVKRNRPPRVLVVADSDGEWPGEVKTHAQTIRSECLKQNIPCPPLNKRTAENYIPDSIWQALANDPTKKASIPMVNALFALSPTQRDHVKMGNQNELPWDAKNTNAERLFSGVPQPVVDALKNYNLKGKGKSMVIFLLETYKASLTADGLISRDSQGELLSLVRQIENEL